MRPVRLDHVVIAVSDWKRSNAFCFVWPGPIEGALDHLAARGVVAEEGPVERPGARCVGRSLYFRDPDGSLLELISDA